MMNTRSHTSAAACGAAVFLFLFTSDGVGQEQPLTAGEEHLLFSGKVVSVDPNTHVATIEVRQLRSALPKSVILTGADPRTTSLGIVRLRSKVPLTPGQESSFETQIVAFADVLELANAAPAAPRALVSDVLAFAEATKKIAMAADAVVSGQVSEVHCDPPPRVLSEHDPRWCVATVQVSRSSKGGVAAGTSMAVRYPSSADVAWKDYPKLKIGEQSIALRRTLKTRWGLGELPAAFDAIRVVSPAELRVLEDFLSLQ